MNPKSSPEITVEILLALRKENDAVRLITERLRVKEMGPADHIRTKHEVKAFVQSGIEAIAKSLIKRSTERREIGQELGQRLNRNQSQRP